MPELSEVEIFRRNLERWWSGRVASDVRVVDPDVFDGPAAGAAPEILTRQASSIRRRGKYILIALEPHVAVLHLRMTGKVVRAERPDTRFARVSWFVPDVGWLTFKDPRRLGGLLFMRAEELADYTPLKTMGPEPHDLDGLGLLKRLGGRRRLKDKLLDQKTLAGVGNIAISELFWRLSIPPEIRCHEVTEELADALAHEMPRYFDWLTEEQLSEEIAYVHEPGSDNPFSVYGREGEPCPRCAGTIARATFGNRSTYYCPQCQS
ncbi:MAG: DNA-formamidopyrimidine glycosylase family protein [Myxococcota bacterium]